MEKIPAGAQQIIDCMVDFRLKGVPSENGKLNFLSEVTEGSLVGQFLKTRGWSAERGRERNSLGHWFTTDTERTAIENEGLSSIAFLEFHGVIVKRRNPIKSSTGKVLAILTFYSLAQDWQAKLCALNGMELKQIVWRDVMRNDIKAYCLERDSWDRGKGAFDDWKKDFARRYKDVPVNQFPDHSLWKQWVQRASK